MLLDLNHRRLPGLIASAAFLSLAACGGGGGGGSGTNGAPPDGMADPTPQPITTLNAFFVSSFDAFEAAAANLRNNDPRYTVQSGTLNTFPDHPRTPINEAGSYFSNPLISAGIEYAHAAGLTGAGQLIAIIDNGFRQTHEAFAGKTNTSVGNPPILHPDDTVGHGTMVASIAAGNSGYMIGVAPGADLMFGNWTDPALATNQARIQGAVAINNSWGYSTTYATQANFDAYFVNDTYGASYLQALRDYTANGVVIFAVSNTASARNASIMEALPIFDTSLAAGWLAVGNAVPIYNGTDITDVALYSAGCWEAARWCIQADGFWTAASAGSDTEYSSGTGSSFAAPMVAGAMALLAEAFPTLTPHQLRARLLASADNSFTGFTPDGQVELADGFFHDYSNIYGHGFLDVRAALLPIGPTTLTVNDGQVVKVTDAQFTSGTAMGDALTGALAGIELAVADSLNGGFKMGGEYLATEVRPASLGTGLIEKTLASNLTAARTAGTSAPRGAFADHQGLSLSMGKIADTGLNAELLVQPEGSTTGDFGVAISKPLIDAGFRLDLDMKFARDEGQLLGFGGRTGSAGGTEMAAVGLTLTRDFANGTFFALSGETGLAELATPVAIANTSSAAFNSYGLSVGRRGVLWGGDRLSLGLSTPTAVTSGSAQMNVALATADGGAEMSTLSLTLAPEARQSDISLSYQIPVGRRGEAALRLLHSDNYGNRDGQWDSAGVVAYTLRF